MPFLMTACQAFADLRWAIACPVTRPPAIPYVPPASAELGDPPEGDFWYGSDTLWTALRHEATWSQLPADPSGGLVQKVVWWREGYDAYTEPQPALTVSGRRLGLFTDTFVETEATNGMHPDWGSFMLVGIAIPSAGCWEITAEYGGNALSYVVRVQP